MSTVRGYDAAISSAVRSVSDFAFTAAPCASRLFTLAASSAAHINGVMPPGPLAFASAR
jgi:hypothetical protein